MIWFGVSTPTVIFSISVVLLPFAIVNLAQGRSGVFWLSNALFVAVLAALVAILGGPLWPPALALSIGGAYFMWVYLREFATTGSRQSATLESTTAHTVYNGVIIVLVYIAVIWVAVAGGGPV